MTSKQTGHLLDQGHSDPKCWTTMFQNEKENRFKFQVKSWMMWEKSGCKRLWWCDPGLGRWKKWTKNSRKVKVKKYQDATLAWNDGLWSFLVKKQFWEAEKLSVVGISRMNCSARAISEISSRMKNDLQAILIRWSIVIIAWFAQA